MPCTHRPRWSFAVPLLALAAASFGLCCLAAADAPQGRRYALLVGVKNYDRDQLHGLQYTENDVNDLTAVLKDAGYKRVVLMTQSEAAAQGDNALLPTARNVRRQLAALLDDRKPDDTVLVAFSGHGVQFSGQKESYFCPMDADLEDAKSLVSLAEVYKALEDSAAGTKVLLADACRNDPQAAPSKDAAKVKLESRTRPQAERPPGGVAALFSCSEGQRSYESEKLGHGVFFHFVIEGLKGEAANKKGEVTLQGLAAYVADEVPDAVKDVSPEARQRPQQVGDLSGAVPLAAAGERDMKETPYYPLRVGTTWTYKEIRDGPTGSETRELVTRVTKHEKIDGTICARLELTANGKVYEPYFALVKEDGVYRTMSGSPQLDRLDLMLKLPPPRGEDAWERASVLDPKRTIKYTEADGVEIAVRGEKYTAVLISTEFPGTVASSLFKDYYVKGIGLVKREETHKLPIGVLTTVQELERFQPGGK